MFQITKWQKVLYLAFAVGAVGFSAYGIMYTINTFKDINQSANTENTITATSDINGDNLISGGCSPYGCAACAGCVKLQYQQKVETLPTASTNITQVY